jgi:hypothetical protein
MTQAINAVLIQEARIEMRPRHKKTFLLLKELF